MKRTSMIPLSPVRKRMDAVVDDVVDGLEQKTLLERISEYEDGIGIKEKELNVLEEVNRAELEQLQRETCENEHKIETVNDEILRDTVSKMENYVSVEAADQVGLDDKVKELQIQREALQKQLQDLQTSIEVKIVEAEHKLQAQEAMERNKRNSNLKLMQAEVIQLQSDVSHLAAAEADHVTDITNIETEIENLNGASQTLKSNLSGNGDRLEQLKKASAQLELQLQEAELDKSVKLNELSKTKNEWSTVRDQYMKVKAQRATLEQHVSTLKNS